MSNVHIFRVGRWWALAGFLAALVLLLQLVGAPVGAQTQDWTQLGGDLDGQVAGNEFGDSVAISGDGLSVVVGTPLSNGGTGHARIFTFDGTAWTQVGTDINGEVAGDEFGESVAISDDGNTVAIGAPANDGIGVDAGHARVFTFDGTVWTQVGLNIDGEAAGDTSGTSVSISADGNTVAIGAPLADGPNGVNAGHARIFTFDGTVWSQVGLDIDGENPQDRSGVAVDLSADANTVIIGARFNDDTGVSAGHARVYGFDGTAWTQVGIDIDGEAAGDQFGFDVAVSADGTTVAVGATGNDDAGANAGHTRVFRFDGTVWNQLGIDIDGEAAFDLGNYSLDISADGNRVAIGAPRNDGNGSQSGHVRVFSYDGTAWQQAGTDIDGEVARDESGTSVGISSDGGTVVIGAPNNDDGGADAGHARVYEMALPEPPAMCNGLLITVDLAAGDVPTVDADVILGTPGADAIAGLGGDDTICGEGGNDTINAGPGNDWVDGGDDDDVIFGLDGDDILNGGDGIDEIVGFAGDDTINGGQGDDTLNGGPDNDTINGDAGNDDIFGQGDDDALNGGDGDDFIIGVDGNDTLNGGPGNDTLNGGPDNDTINGGSDDDVIFGLAGDDTLNGDAGNDQVFGQVGNDVLDGGDGDDSLFGNEEDDTISDPTGTNIINGGPGDDTITGSDGVDDIFGDGDLLQAGNDIIDGGLGGPDRLIGFAGDDTITSLNGVIDVINGGPHTTGDTCTTDPDDTVFNCE